MKKKAVAGILTSVMCMAALAGCQSNTNADTSSDSLQAVTGTISVVSREKGSGTRDAFIELTGILLKDSEGNSTDRTSEDAIVLSSTEGVLSNISGDLQSIGYISLGSLNDKVKAVSIDGVAPSIETITDGTYKISRPFNIAVNSEGLSDAAQDFISYIMSAEGQQIIADNGYVRIDENAAAYAKSTVTGKVTVAGSTSVAPVMTKLKEAYAEINSDVTIEIQTSDSSSGMSAATEGRCDIGMASRDLKDSELETLTAATIAKDGIVVVINNGNSLDNLSMEQVCEIFMGETTAWEEIE